MEGNGHKKTVEEMAQAEVFQGARVTFKELQRQDGLIAEGIDKTIGKSMGVIQSVLSPCDDKNYRQILKHTRWKNTEEQDKCINALANCDLTGAINAKHVILDRLTARSAGLDGALIKESYDALTHTTFTTENRGKNDNRNFNNTGPVSK